MKWTLTAFRFSSNRLLASAIRSIRLAFAFLFFSASSFPFFSARADDSTEFEETNPLLRIDDLTPEGRTAVSNLALSITYNSSGDRSAPTLEENVAAILAVLNSARVGTVSYVSPSSSFGISRFLYSFLHENGANGSLNEVPASSGSYLYEIQRALYGQSGIPSRANSVISLLLALSQRDFASNVWTRADIDRLFSISNAWDSSSVSTLLDYVSNSDSYLGNLNYLVNDFSSIIYYLYGMQSQIFDSNLFDNFAYRVEDEVLKNIYESVAKNASSDDPAIRVVDAYAHESFDALADELAKLNESVSGQVSSDESYTNFVFRLFNAIYDDVENIESQVDLYFPQYADYWYQLLYYNLGYHLRDGTISTDLLDLRRQLGVESPSRTNSIFGILQRFFDDSDSRQLVSSTGSIIKAEIRAAEESAETAISSSEEEVTGIAEDEEPDWYEHRFTGQNPLDSGDNIFDLPTRQANSAFLPLAESQHKEIVLFRGNFPMFGGQSSRAQSNVSLDISYPLVDYDAVSGGFVTMRSIMEWVWTWVALCINVLMLFRFYQSLARSAIGAEQGFFNE